MADFPSREELFRRWRDGAITVPDTRVSPSEIDLPGSDLNLVAAAAAILGEEVVSRMARLYAGVFEDTATGQCLDRVIFDRKGITRKPAAPATGELVLTRPTAAAGAGTVDGGLPGSTPQPTRFITNTGITYLLLEDAVFGATDLSVTVRAQAELAGTAYTVADNQAWTPVDPVFDTTLVATNPVEMAGAEDEETDDKFRARARAFFPTLRRGTLQAIEFGLRAAAGVDAVSVQEVLNTSGLPYCAVEAFVLDVLGQSNDTLAARAQGELEEFRALGIPVFVRAGRPDFISIALTPVFDARIINDTQAAAADIRSAIITAVNSLQPGQTLDRTRITAAALSVPGVSLPDGALTEPVADLEPGAIDIAIRTKRELIAIG